VAEYLHAELVSDGLLLRFGLDSGGALSRTLGIAAGLALRRYEAYCSGGAWSLRLRIERDYDLLGGALVNLSGGAAQIGDLTVAIGSGGAAGYRPLLVAVCERTRVEAAGTADAEGHVLLVGDAL